MRAIVEEWVLQCFPCGGCNYEGIKRFVCLTPFLGSALLSSSGTVLNLSPALFIINSFNKLLKLYYQKWHINASTGISVPLNCFSSEAGHMVHFINRTKQNFYTPIKDSKRRSALNPCVIPLGQVSLSLNKNICREILPLGLWGYWPKARLKPNSEELVGTQWYCLFGPLTPVKALISCKSMFHSNINCETLVINIK